MGNGGASMTISTHEIHVAAAIIVNAQGQLLLVRKKNTQYFMQVGGKLEPNEAPELTILREISEEIGCDAHIEAYLGRFETAAANEPDHLLISHVFKMALKDEPKIAAEIEEMIWFDPCDQVTLIAPLTREVVLPWLAEQTI